MDILEAFDEPGFYILAGLGVAMEVIGYLAGKKMGLGTFPMWQFIILILGTLCAAAFFALKD